MRKFIFQGIVRLEKNKPSKVGYSVLWLDYVTIRGWFESRARKKAISALEKEYPEYKGHIQLI